MTKPIAKIFPPRVAARLKVAGDKGRALREGDSIANPTAVQYRHIIAEIDILVDEAKKLYPELFRAEALQ